MEKATWDNPNKMHIDSGFKTFDKQTTLITTGNVIAPTQTSWFIRPFNEVKNGYYEGKPGEFLEYDLKHFIDPIPHQMKEKLYDKNRTESYILYKFFVMNKKETDVIGYVLTDSHYNYIDHSVWISSYRCSVSKREAALREAMRYICA